MEAGSISSICSAVQGLFSRNTPPSLSAETLKSARFFSVSETGESVATELSDRKLNRIV